MRILDLFCGAGGASMGYHLAGWEVVGVDIAPQKHYPFKFYQADAMSFPLDGFDAIHASPPCQDYSATRVMPHTEKGYQPKVYPRLIAPTIERLRATGVPFIVENVRGAEVEMPGSIELCGTMFGLRSRRHRIFQSSELLFSAGTCNHAPMDILVFGASAEYLGSRGTPYKDGKGGQRYRRMSCRKAEACKAMGIDWMTFEEMSESIPPIFTQWLGGQLLDALRQAA